MEKFPGNGSSYIVYISKDHDKASALHLPMVALGSAHKSIDGWEWHVSTVEVHQDCRIPSLYHGAGIFATIIEHNNGDWDKAPTYEIHFV